MLLDDNRKTLILTGLSQEPYEETKLYWRLTSHRDFLKDINVSFKDVRPRMTRILKCISKAMHLNKSVKRFWAR